jgi:hypothetical protein
MSTVTAVAAECKIPGIQVKWEDGENLNNVFNKFYLDVQGEIARIRIRGRGACNPYSVQLAPNTRKKIDHHISRIKHAIETSDLSSGRKKALNAKLDELAEELSNQRLGFAKTMAVLGAVLVGLAAATTVAAEGPTAVTNIMKLIAADKESEDAARLRLATPPKALPPPAEPIISIARRQAAPSWDNHSTEFDDEIPF